MSHPSTIQLSEDRFDRFRKIAWWDQARIQSARVLVIGAGALGNEVIKNLALLGVGHLAIVDMDSIEQSNLCRSVLFRESDEGKPKAVVASQTARDLYPDMHAIPLVGNLMADIGLGWFRWADVVVGALDNREARVSVNSSCAQTGTPWIDGGIDVLNGIVRGFSPPLTACYECTMGENDWKQLNQRRSCSLLARSAAAGGGTPTTPTTASVIGAIQAQEVIKRLHDLPTLNASGFVFEGLGHHSYTVHYSINPDCPWHAPIAAIHSQSDFSQNTPLVKIWEYLEAEMGSIDAIDFPREIVVALHCAACGIDEPIFQPIDRIQASIVPCPQCQQERFPELLHSIDRESKYLSLTVAEIGLPPWDILWGRNDMASIGVELSGDAPHALQGLRP